MTLPQSFWDININTIKGTALRAGASQMVGMLVISDANMRGDPIDDDNNTCSKTINFGFDSLNEAIVAFDFPAKRENAYTVLAVGENIQIRVTKSIEALFRQLQSHSDSPKLANVVGALAQSSHSLVAPFLRVVAQEGAASAGARIRACRPICESNKGGGGNSSQKLLAVGLGFQLLSLGAPPRATEAFRAGGAKQETPRTEQCVRETVNSFGEREWASKRFKIIPALVPYHAVEESAGFDGDLPGGRLDRIIRVGEGEEGDGPGVWGPQVRRRERWDDGEGVAVFTMLVENLGSGFHGHGDHLAVAAVEVLDAVGVTTAQEAGVAESEGTCGLVFDDNGHDAAMRGEGVEEDVKLDRAVVVG